MIFDHITYEYNYEQKAKQPNKTKKKLLDYLIKN